MISPMNRFCLASLLWLFLILRSPALSPDDPCPVCGKKFGEKAYGLIGHGQEEPIHVCGECVKLDTFCYICGVPVKDRMTRLADGRLLCEKDTKQAVLDPFEARNIFDEVKRDAQTILSRSGALPSHNISLVLEARERLDKSGSNLISAHDDGLLMGLTRSLQRGPGDFEHTVYLLHGLTRDRMKVVAAHEYGHVWLHENVNRNLNLDTVEGFCDWLAYKVIKEKNLPNEMKVLLASEYSRGQLQAFIMAEEEKSFYRVIQWVKDGIDPRIDFKHLDRILQLREPAVEPAAAFSLTFTPPPPRSAPTNLVLKGLSGSKARRFALINNSTFVLNEQGKVQLGDSNVVVQCVAIGDDAVTIQVAGENAPRTLALSVTK